MPKTAKKAHGELAERRREEILDAAARLFAERGYSETDTQVLADELGVGKGTIYRYFKSKRDLFLAAADRVMRQLREHMRQSRDAVADPVERVRVAIRAFLEYCGRHPEFVELLMQERAQFKDRTRPTYLAHREVYIGYWQDLYRTMIDDGQLRDIPVERITDAVHALLYGTLFTNYFARSTQSVDEQVEGVVDILFHGILSPAERRRRGQA